MNEPITLTPNDPWAAEAHAALRRYASSLVWVCVGDATGDWVLYGQVQRNHPGLFTIHHNPADPDGLRWQVGYTHDDYGNLGVTRLGDLPQVTEVVNRVATDPERAFGALSLT